jgi:hypothetical protein
MTALRSRVSFLILALAGCSGDGGTGVDADGSIARMEVTAGANVIPIGESTTLKAVAYDGAGTVVSNVQVMWSSAAQSIAVVTVGKVTGVAPGTAQISATANGVTASRTIEVANVNDVAILDARLTQGVQESDQSIPIIVDGLPAVVNVLLRPRVREVPPGRFVMRLLNASGQVEFADTVSFTGNVPDRGYLVPTIQFLIPAQYLHFGLRWQVERDPAGSTPDDSTHNDVFPRVGSMPLPIVEVPTLGVHLVPVRLASEGGVTGTVSTSLIESYMRDVRRMLPIGKIDVTMGDTLVSTQTFGIKPTGGDNIFWSRILSELDAARMASAAHRQKHWIGFVTRPSGYTSQEFGGLGYKPTPWRGDGVGTRTSAVTAISVFMQDYVRAAIAHELGHNFGRSHAPCGNPSNPDLAFPFAGGRIGEIGHDVYSWSAGFTNFAAGIPTTAGDLMGYCAERWASSYTYRGILEFRRLSDMVVNANNDSRSSMETSSTVRVPSLLVSGMRSDSIMTIFPPEERVMPPLQSIGGENRLELLDRGGAVLYSASFDFDGTSVERTGTFLHWIPLSSIHGTIEEVRIITPRQRKTFAFRVKRP